MNLLLKNIECSNETLVLNSITLEYKFIEYKELKLINGWFKNIDNNVICFYKENNKLKMLYSNNVYNINDVFSFKQTSYDNILIIKYGKDKIKIKEKRVIRNFDYITMDETEDYNFLEFIYNISRSKNRQKLILKNLGTSLN